MKRILLICLLFLVYVFNACQSDNISEGIDAENVINDSEWKFTKDVTLTNGGNTAYLRICSNYKDSLNIYLENIEIKLNVITVKQKSEISSASVNNKDNNESLVSHFNYYEPSVVVVYLGGNFLPDVASYGISFKPKLLKSYYGPLPIAAHETMGKFLGIITEDDGGLDLMVTFYHKSSFFSSWTQIATSSRTKRPGYNYYFWDFDTYKNRMQVYRDIDDTVYPSYTVYTVVNDFQRTGTNCLIGSYDGATCYVGTPPTGTTAFIYNNKFYYTPVDGNQCPLAGSSYDGGNCLVANVPEFAVPSIWNNKWYVLPYITSNLFGKQE